MDGPVFVVPDENLVPVSDHLGRMMSIPPSRMFLMMQGLEVFRKNHPDREAYDASQGDGGDSLPGVPKEILEKAARMQIEHGTAYDMPAGCPAFRRAVIEQYWKLDPGLGVGPNNVVAAVGGRDALTKAYEAMLTLGYGRMGDALVVSRVPWVSYNWGPYSVGANVLLAPGDEKDAWEYTPEGIRSCVDFAARTGRKVACLVITNPDNPTGRTISIERQVELGRAALEAGIGYVLYDWMYHYVTDESPMDLNAFLALFTSKERQRIIIMDGLTKSLGASNIRNAHLIVTEEMAKFISARASHTVVPDYYAQAVAMVAFEMGYANAIRSINEPISASRIVLKKFLDERGLTYIMGKGYYAFIHVGKWLKAKGWKDTELLGQYLAEDHGIAIVPGVYFSRFGGEWLRFSYALPPERTLASVERLMEGLDVIAAS